MTGGQAYVYDPELSLPAKVNPELVSIRQARRAAADVSSRAWVAQHAELTGSARAAPAPRRLEGNTPTSSGASLRRPRWPRSRGATRGRPSRPRLEQPSGPGPQRGPSRPRWGIEWVEVDPKRVVARDARRREHPALRAGSTAGPSGVLAENPRLHRRVAETPPTGWCSGLELKVNHLRPARDGWLNRHRSSDSSRPDDAALGDADHRRGRAPGGPSPPAPSPSGHRTATNPRSTERSPSRPGPPSGRGSKGRGSPDRGEPGQLAQVATAQRGSPSV